MVTEIGVDWKGEIIVGKVQKNKKRIFNIMQTVGGYTTPRFMP
jgi:Na+/H+ antiporter NhaA